MFEFEVVWTNGERGIIFGYNLEDACRRCKCDIHSIQHILFEEYVD